MDGVSKQVVPEQKSSMLRRWGVRLLWGLGAWISIALMAYGLALRRYAGSTPFLSAGEASVDSVSRAMESRSGRIGTVRQGWSGSGSVEFEFEGGSERFRLPAELLENAEFRENLSRVLRPGARFKVQSLGADRIILDLQSNPGTVFQRQHLEWRESLRRMAGAPARAEGRARLLLAAGALLACLLGCAYFFRGRWRKIFLSASTTGSE